MLRNVLILHRGQVVATFPVELDGGKESDFVMEAIQQALRQGTFHGRSARDIEFKVDPPMAPSVN